MKRVVLHVAGIAVLVLGCPTASHAIDWQTLERLRWGKSVATVDSVLSTKSDASGLDSLGIRRYADSLFGFSCEIIPVADRDSVDALLIRFHTQAMFEGEFGMTYDLLVDELQSKYGKPDEFRRSGYSPMLQSIMRRHAIWDDSTDQVLLLADRDTKFAPLLDLVIARTSAQLGGSEISETPPSSRTGLMSWLIDVSPAIQPPYLMHPKDPFEADPLALFDDHQMTMPELIAEQKPEYPEQALRKGGEGTVWIRALVDEEGTVSSVRLAKPSETGFDFESSCITAAFGNKYKPATRNGVPVPVWVAYPVEFRLR